MPCNHQKRHYLFRFTEIFDKLDQEIIWLHAKYRIFFQLFAHSEERIRFLSEKAPGFFRVTQDVLLHDIILSLSRLTDPPITRGKENLSIRTLNKFAKRLDDCTFYSDISSRVEDIVALCKPFRTWRNKRIAHTDLPTVLKYNPDPLPGISRKMIENVLRRLRELFNYIIGHFEDSETAYEHVIYQGDGDTIVFLLERADELKRQEMEHWRSKITENKDKNV